MSNVFFTSDYHLGHANIIKFCGRPFKDVDHMNESLIRNHNARVRDTDMVYHIGDFMFRSRRHINYYLERLNGNIILLKGNHDKNNKVPAYIHRCVIRYGGMDFGMFHNPAAEFPMRYNLVGHVHEKWRFKKDSYGNYFINVGVDVWKFMPVTINEIIAKFNRWKNGTDYEKEEVYG